MKTDAEFDMWIEQCQQEIHTIVQRATWRMAAILLVWGASMFAMLVIAMDR